MTAGFLIAAPVAYLLAEDKRYFWYDLFNGFAAGLGTNVLLLIGFSKLWEKDADPSKPPYNTGDDAKEGT